MGRPPCCGEEYHKEQGVMRKGAWTAEEDEKLVAFMKKNKGHGSWRTLPKLAGLERCGKSCRLRWTNYLRPNIKRGNFSADEEGMIVQLHAVMGNKWSAIASHLPGRTDNEVKNHWNTHLKKKLTRLGIDPATHLPFSLLPAPLPVNRNDPSTSVCRADWQKALLQHSLEVNSTIACHLVQWELARLEAEARQQLPSPHGPLIQNYYASYLQSLHPNQFSGYAFSSLLPGASVPTQSVNDHSSSPTEIQSSQASDTNYVPSPSPLPCHGNARSPSISILESFECPPLSNGESDHSQEDCVLPSASWGSRGAIDTCSSADSLSSHLLSSHFDVPDELLSLDLSSDESQNPAMIFNSHESSPSFLDNPNTSQEDSYWNKVLNFLDQISPDNLQVCPDGDAL